MCVERGTHVRVKRVEYVHVCICVVCLLCLWDTRVLYECVLSLWDVSVYVCMWARPPVTAAVSEHRLCWRGGGGPWEHPHSDIVEYGEVILTKSRR